MTLPSFKEKGIPGFIKSIGVHKREVAGRGFELWVKSCNKSTKCEEKRLLRINMRVLAQGISAKADLFPGLCPHLLLFLPKISPIQGLLLSWFI